MGTTVPLEVRWGDYFRPGFKPTTAADRTRVALLSGKPLRVEDDDPAGARISGIVRTMERLGYEIERLPEVGGRSAYRVRNTRHRPTPEQFAAVRASAHPKRSEVEVVGSNGHAPTSSPRRGGLRALARMLPPLAEDLVVSAVGFSEEGSPFLVVVSPDGWRYSCSVEQATPPRQ